MSHVFPYCSMGIGFRRWLLKSFKSVRNPGLSHYYLVGSFILPPLSPMRASGDATTTMLH
jgi:hypothetical protein